MKNRETFNFYRSFFEAGKDMEDKDRLAFYDAILLSSFEDKNSELSGLAKIVFTAIKPVIDNQTTNYKNGKKGGRPSTNNPPLSKKNNPPLQKKESYKEKEKDNKNKTINNYDYFISILQGKASVKSKVSKTNDGRQLFKNIQDKEKLMSDYLSYQLEKKEFAVRITPYMQDYNSLHMTANNTHVKKLNPALGGYN